MQAVEYTLPDISNLYCFPGGNFQVCVCVCANFEYMDGT